MIFFIINNFLVMFCKEVIQSNPKSTRYFEIFQEIEAEKKDGSKVKVIQLIEKECLENLLSRKEVLVSQLSELDEKIKLVSDIIG